VKERQRNPCWGHIQGRLIYSVVSGRDELPGIRARPALPAIRALPAAQSGHIVGGGEVTALTVGSPSGAAGAGAAGAAGQGHQGLGLLSLGLGLGNGGDSLGLYSPLPDAAPNAYNLTGYSDDHQRQEVGNDDGGDLAALDEAAAAEAGLSLTSVPADSAALAAGDVAAEVLEQARALQAQGRHVAPLNPAATTAYDSLLSAYSAAPGAFLHDVPTRGGPFPVRVSFFCTAHSGEDHWDPELRQCSICDRSFEPASMFSDVACHFCRDLAILARPESWLRLPFLRIEQLDLPRVVAALCLVHDLRHLPRTLNPYGVYPLTVAPQAALPWAPPASAEERELALAGDIFGKAQARRAGLVGDDGEAVGDGYGAFYDDEEDEDGPDEEGRALIARPGGAASGGRGHGSSSTPGGGPRSTTASSTGAGSGAGAGAAMATPGVGRSSRARRGGRSGGAGTPGGASLHDLGVLTPHLASPSAPSAPAAAGPAALVYPFPSPVQQNAAAAAAAASAGALPWGLSGPSMNQAQAQAQVVEMGSLGASRLGSGAGSRATDALRRAAQARHEAHNNTNSAAGAGAGADAGAGGAQGAVMRFGQPSGVGRALSDGPRQRGTPLLASASGVGAGAGAEAGGSRSHGLQLPGQFVPTVFVSRQEAEARGAQILLERDGLGASRDPATIAAAAAARAAAVAAAAAEAAALAGDAALDDADGVPLSAFLQGNADRVGAQLDAIRDALVRAKEDGRERAVLCVDRHHLVRVLADDQCAMPAEAEEIMHRTDRACPDVLGILTPFFVIMTYAKQKSQCF